MNMIYRGNTLTKEEQDQIWEILCACDEEFYPRLSARESSSQKRLDLGEGGGQALPVTYFREMIRQEFILALEGERIIGFMTFKKDYICDALQAFGTSLYITTVCVRSDCRRKGVMKALYTFMEQEAPVRCGCSRISTRTWSLNTAQLHELDRRGYERLAVLVDDRGKGVDTVYFGLDCGRRKECGEEMAVEEIRERFPYFYETHLHTSQGSACGRKPGAQMAQVCKAAGYTGIFVTDHNWGGNTAVDRSLPWEEWVDRFAEGYRDARRMGEKIGLDVFYGWEAGYQGPEFLIYGLTPEWMREHPELHDADVEKQYAIVKKAGGMVIQAHPFRRADYIQDIRLFPDAVDGVEGMNASHIKPLDGSDRNMGSDGEARAYAREHHFPMTAGSDVHDTALLGGGMAFSRRLQGGKDFIQAVLGGEEYAMTDGESWYLRNGVLLHQGRV